MIKKSFTPFYHHIISEQIFCMFNKPDFNEVVKQVPILISFLPLDLQKEFKAEYLEAMGKLLLKILTRLNDEGYTSKK